jgi:hypothetical protein
MLYESHETCIRSYLFYLILGRSGSVIKSMLAAARERHTMPCATSLPLMVADTNVLYFGIRHHWNQLHHRYLALQNSTRNQEDQLGLVWKSAISEATRTTCEGVPPGLPRGVDTNVLYWNTSLLGSCITRCRRASARYRTLSDHRRSLALTLHDDQHCWKSVRWLTTTMSASGRRPHQAVTSQAFHTLAFAE